jgi:hypothetical protein
MPLPKTPIATVFKKLVVAYVKAVPVIPVPSFPTLPGVSSGQTNVPKS